MTLSGPRSADGPCRYGMLSRSAGIAAHGTDTRWPVFVSEAGPRGPIGERIGPRRLSDPSDPAHTADLADPADPADTADGADCHCPLTISTYVPAVTADGCQRRALPALTGADEVPPLTLLSESTDS